jgi:hypothetical protein
MQAVHMKQDGKKLYLMYNLKKCAFITTADRKNVHRNASPLITWETMKICSSCYRIS